MIQTINTRIKLLRKKLGYNQHDFAKKLGVGQTSISFLEKDGSTVTEQNIKAITKLFNINEEWLRTGNGEMYTPLTREEEIMKFIAKVQGANNAVAKKILLLLAKLDEKDWETIDKILTYLVNDEEKEG